MLIHNFGASLLAVTVSERVSELGLTQAGPRFEVSSERREKGRIDLTSPDW